MQRPTTPRFPVESITSRGHSSSDSTQVEAVAKTSTESRSTDRKNARKVFSQRTNSLLGIQIIGSGSYVPDQVVTNEDLEAERAAAKPSVALIRSGSASGRGFSNGVTLRTGKPPVISASRQPVERSGRHGSIHPRSTWFWSARSRPTTTAPRPPAWSRTSWASTPRPSTCRPPARVSSTPW